jgi:uncharacterized membrane protein HdeD (DUF308 family)
MEASPSVAGAFESLRSKWGWILALGVALIVLGMIALGDTFAVTFFSVILLGWLLIGSAIVHVVHLIRHTEVRSFWSIVTIILDVVAGAFLIANPAIGALTLTLVLAAFFLARGIMQIVGALRADTPHRFWPIVSGIVSLLLGLLLWLHWPWSGLWFIGLAIGIELIFRGWTFFMLALMLRSRAPRAAMSRQPV